MDGAPIRLRPMYGEGVLRLDAPGGAVAIRSGAGRAHAVIGPIDEICTAAFEALTVVGRVDWRAPDRIPPVLEPARLPPGSGTGLLNVLAENAAGPLRYRGPYPTAALFESLSTCFRTEAPVSDFTEGVEAAAIAGRVVEPDVWFEPAPFARYRTGAVVVEIRGGVVEAIYVHGARFDRRARVGRRVVRRGQRASAVFEVPGHAPRELAGAEVSGRLVGPVAPVAPPEGAHLGRPLPGPITAAIVAAAMSKAPALLVPAIAAIGARGAAWADTGLALAGVISDRIALHGDLATGDLEPAERLAALIEAAVPGGRVALRLAQRHLSPG